MATENKQLENQPLPASAEPTVTSCRRSVTSEDAGFMQNVKTRFDDFINTPMAEHKECLKYSVQKMVNMAKIGGEKKPELKEAESPTALQASSAE